MRGFLLGWLSRSFLGFTLLVVALGLLGLIVLLVWLSFIAINNFQEDFVVLGLYKLLLIAAVAFFLLFWGLVLIYQKVRADADIDIKGDIVAGKITTGSAGLLLVFFSVIVMLYVALTKFEVSQSSTGTTMELQAILSDLQQLKAKAEASRVVEEEFKLLKKVVGALNTQVQELRLILEPILITDNMPQLDSPCPDKYHLTNVANELERGHDFNQDGVVCKPVN